jgi:hypothetical protein
MEWAARQRFVSRAHADKARFWRARLPRASSDPQLFFGKFYYCKSKRYFLMKTNHFSYEEGDKKSSNLSRNSHTF